MPFCYVCLMFQYFVLSWLLVVVLDVFFAPLTFHFILYWRLQQHENANKKNKITCTYRKGKISATEWRNRRQKYACLSSHHTHTCISTWTAIEREKKHREIKGKKIWRKKKLKQLKRIGRFRSRCKHRHPPIEFIDIYEYFPYLFEHFGEQAPPYTFSNAIGESNIFFHVRRRLRT